MSDLPELIIGNWFGVMRAVGADAVLLPRGLPSRLTREEALNLAAYLAVVADPLGIQFDAILTQLRRERTTPDAY